MSKMFMKMVAPPFFTDARIRECLAQECRFNTLRTEEEFGCNLKTVAIGDSGMCEFFEHEKEEVDNAD